ncbi:MAG TPA: hypothetical protein VGD61_15715 [Pyrinomonadaceae bacterium]
MSITYYSIVEIFFTPLIALIASCSSAATSTRRLWSMSLTIDAATSEGL